MRAMFLVIAVTLLLALGSLEVLASRSASIASWPALPTSGPWR